jgi:DNA ligase-1
MNPHQLPLMKCHLYDPKKLKFPCWAQPKLNGLSARYYQGNFYSADSKEFSKYVVEHMKDELKQHIEGMPEDIMLVGEFYHHGWDLGRISSACSVIRHFATEDSLKIEFYVYDFWSSVTFKDVNFNFRYKMLKDNNIPHLVDTYPILTIEEADQYYDVALDNGYEGVVYKMQDCLYKDGRSHYSLKRKKVKDAEFICEGLQQGKGKYSKTLGALILRSDYGNTFTAGGMKDADREKFWKNPNCVVGKMVTIRFQELSSAGIPINPRFVAVRDYE